MKKNIFKKIVASLATVAMAAGLFTAMPAEEAKAAATTKEVIFVLSDKTAVDEVLVEIASNVATCSAEQKEIPGWGGEKGYVTTSLGDGKYKLTLSVTDTVSTTPNNYCTLKFVGLKDGAFVKGQNIHTQNYADKYNAGDVVYIALDMSVNSWSDNSGKCDAVTDITVPTPEQDSTQSTENPTQSTENSTQSTENSTQSTENSTQSTENSTQATENSTQATQTTTKKEEATTAKKVDSVTVTVEWKDAPEGDVNIHAWGAASTNYPGQKMTANGDGTYTTTLKLTSEGKISFVVNVGGDANKTKDITDVDTSTGKIVIKISKDADGKLVGTANAVSTGNVSGGTGSAKPGDSAPIVMMFAVAAVAAGMVVASKKKTICE